MSAPLSILIIATAHAALGPTPNATGLWLQELSDPYYEFLDAGANVAVATLPGGNIPIDPHSVGEKGKNPASVERFLADEKASAWLKNATPLSQLKAQGWDIVFVPGGHGAMWELGSSENLGRFLSDVWKNQSVLGSVCHGAAALVNVKDETGAPLVKGRTVNSFTDSEEAAMKLASVVPFPLETKLRELGANFEKGENFSAFTVSDGCLVTGQNPASSLLVAKGLLKAAQERQH